MASFPPLASSSTALSELQSRHSRRVFCLRLDGLPFRYYSGAAPPTTSTGATSPTNYTDIQAITHVGNLSGKLDPAGGIAEFSPITITIQGGHLRELSDGDPTKVFSRLGFRSSTDWAQVITTLEADAASPATLEVDRDPSGWAGIAGLVHVGAEAMYASATGGTGTDVDPYTITVTRAELESKAQSHWVDLDIGDQPIVTTEVVNWRSRRGVLYMAAERPDGSTSDYIELMRGFLERTPVIEGNTVTLELVPLTALLDEELSTERRKFGLAQGFHHFAAPWGCTLQHVQESAGMHISNGASAANSQEITTTRTNHVEDNYDTTLVSGHPRRGAVDIQGQDPVELVGITANTSLDLPANTPVSQVVASTIVNMLATAECHEVRMTSDLDDGTEETLRWPEDALALVNHADGWAPGSTQGTSGQWMDLRIVQDGVDGPHVRVDKNAWHRPTPRIYVRHGNAEFRSSLAHFAREWESQEASDFGAGIPAQFGPRVLHYGIDLSDPEEPRGEYDSWSREVKLEYGFTRFPIRGIARAYFQRGEPYILADADLPVSASGETELLITYTSHLDAEEYTARTIITSSDAVTYDGSTVGYKWTIKDGQQYGMPSFGDWSGLPRVQMVPQVRFYYLPPGIAMLRLLMSGTGLGVNSATYDVLPAGLNLDADDVDFKTFLFINPPPMVDRWNILMEDGEKPRDVLDPLLKSMRANIVMRRDEQGRCRVTLVRAGLENQAEAIGDIANGDWAVDPMPASRSDDKIVNLLTLKTNFDSEGDPQLTVKVPNVASQRRNQEVAEEDLELKGVDLPADGSVEVLLRNMYAGIFYMFGDPRRVWAGRVGTGKALLAELGTVYTVSSDHLRAYGDAGITSKAGRVVSVDIGLWGTEEGASVELVHHGVNATGWNASGWVESWPTATTVTISANAFSATEDPHTGAAQKDVDAFAAGDVVEWVTEADHDTVKGPLTIDSITRSTNTITFTANHGITATGFLQPVEYDSASSAHQSLAYLADTDDNLGASNDDGQTLV